eukprot:1340273-Pleurochrysis_carterae.AAC.2
MRRSTRCRLPLPCPPWTPSPPTHSAPTHSEPTYCLMLHKRTSSSVSAVDCRSHSASASDPLRPKSLRARHSVCNEDACALPSLSADSNAITPF